MVDNKSDKNYQELWMAIAFVLIGCFYYYYSNERTRIIQAVRSHQIDTIATGDSVYLIHARIDSIYYENQHDPADASDNR